MVYMKNRIEYMELKIVKVIIVENLYKIKKNLDFF